MLRLRKVTIPVLLLFAAICASNAHAHEFWLAPSSYTPSTDTRIAIRHTYGQHFKGDELPFVTEWHPRYIVLDQGRERKVRGFEGDLPAVRIKFDKPGLKVFGYFGAHEPHTFETRADFDKYAQKIGYEALARQHGTLGKPATGIVESYARNTKLLLGVGDATGTDRALGLPFELVAEQNPYTLSPGANLPVRLLLNGKPSAGMTITTFSAADPKNPTQTVTDAEGRAAISLPSRGAYLLNTVHMFDPAPDRKADWESLWASMTFAIR